MQYSILIPAIVIGAIILVLVMLYVLQGAVQALKTHHAIPMKRVPMRMPIQLTWVLLVITIGIVLIPQDLFKAEQQQLVITEQDALWHGPDTNQLALLDGPQAELIRYGRELISNTSHYLGPNGTVAQITNGLNCQNCHLDAGTKPWGNNYGAVWSTYPKFRARSGSIETIPARVNDCFERSLNGSPLDTNGHEMNAILAYMEWLGTGVPKGKGPEGSGLVELAFLDRSADPLHGASIYMEKCSSCHGQNGQGLMKADARTFQYPPLWGENSYNVSAGLYRASRFAGYVKANMPLGVSWSTPQLSDEEAWDLAAYVNSQPHPIKFFEGDWPDITTKPFDHPFGPFADTFPEQQHKFGPYGPIAEAKRSLALNK